MMKIIKLTFTILIFLTTIVCKSIPSQNPASQNSSVLALEMEVEQLIGSQTATKVHLVRVDKKVNPGQTLISKSALLATNWSNKGYTYYLNVDPGEYIVVGMEYIVDQGPPQQTSSSTSANGKVTVSTTTGGGSTTYTVITNSEIAEKSKTKVGEGELAYMGSFLISTNKDYDKADSLQKHYANILKPGMLDKTGFFSGLITVDLLGNLKKFTKDEANIIEFKKSAKKSFSETAWSYLTD